MKGRIHSIETFGTVDGPGIRTVIFMQGCALQCKYCHNRDSWNLSGGKEYTADEIIEEVLKYKSYMDTSGGGITISGGEPLMQPDFLYELLKKAKENGIHTCIDTSGSVLCKRLDDILSLTDLVLLDIKHIDINKCINLTGFDNINNLWFARKLSKENIPVWIRQVIVPGMTDDEKDLKRLGEFIKSLNNVEKVELLPYHSMGAYKWEELGFEYPLKGVREANDEDIERAMKILNL